MDARVFIVDSQIFSRLTAPREKEEEEPPLGLAFPVFQNKFHARSQKSLFFLCCLVIFFKSLRPPHQQQRQEQKGLLTPYQI